MPDLTAPESTAQFPRLFRSLVLDPALLLARALDAGALARLVTEEVGPTRDRLFTPAVTTAVFLSQVSSDDQSCRSAVARLLAWRVARGLPACSPDAGGYCKARQRLPESLLPRLAPTSPTGSAIRLPSPGPSTVAASSSPTARR